MIQLSSNLKLIFLQVSTTPTFKNSRLISVFYSVIASKQKPAINDTVTSHIEHLTRYKNSTKAAAPSEIYNKYSTTTALAEKRNQDFEDIHQRLINDKDAVMREARLSNNVSSLRPNANSDYFGNAEMDERSNVQRKNETKVSKVRNTMTPAISSTPQLTGNPLIPPAKTPNLINNSLVKRSQPFLQSNGGFSTAKAGEHRSKTAFQKNQAPSANTRFLDDRGLGDSDVNKMGRSKIVSNHLYQKMISA